MSDSLTGMNAAVRAVTRMGIYVGAKVFLIYEVSGTGHGVACGEVTCMCSCREQIVLCPGVVCCALVCHLGGFQVAGPGLTEWILSGGKGLNRDICRMETLWGLCPLILSHSH